MKLTTLFVVMAVFTLGFGIGGMIASNFQGNEPVLDTKTVMHRGLTSTNVMSEPQEEPVLSAKVTEPDFGIPPDRNSPMDRIQENDIEMRQDGVFIHLNEPQWAVFAATKSMDPTFDAGHHAIQVVPKSTEEIKAGDIISYRSAMGFSVIHRVKTIDEDAEGWYCIVQGDNNPTPDPVKVRFDQITRVVVALIY